jgi:kumamolisin
MKANMHAVAGSERVPLPGAKALGRANAHEVIEVLVKLRRKKEIGQLNARPDVTLDRGTVGSDYGASPADIKVVTDAFQKLGLRVINTNPTTRSVELSGSVAEMEKAFRVNLFNYAHADGNYRGRVGEVFIPEPLKAIITGVFGLDDRRVARRRRHRQERRTAAPTPAHASVHSTWYLPGELAKRYNYPQGDGTGQTIGILEFGGGYFSEDLTNFCDLAKIPEPSVVPISVDGTSTSAQDGAEGEVMLDIEVVAGLCPKSTIAVYFRSVGRAGLDQSPGCGSA